MKILEVIFHIFDSISITLEEKKKKKKRSTGNRILRVFGWIFGILIILVFLIILFIRSPWGQNIVVQRAVKYVSGKTNTKVEVEKLFITFDGNILLKGLYLEDTKGDTLVYSKKLEADIPILPIIRGNCFGIDYLKWEGLRAHVIRKDSLEGYNFQFLIDAFAGEDKPEKPKDTASSPFKLRIGEVFLSDFEVEFDDAVIGIDADVRLGKLNLLMKKIDLEKMDFRASKIQLAETQVKLHQTPVPPTPKEEDTPLPFLQADEIDLKKVLVNYQSDGDRIAADLDISELLLELQKADLVNNDIEIGTFRLRNSLVFLNTETETNVVTETAEDVKDVVMEDIEKFEWPDFTIVLSKLDFRDNHIQYFVAQNKVKPNVFDANAIDLKDLNLQIRDVYLRDKTAGLKLNELSFAEGSGLNLKKLILDLNITDEHLEVDDLALELNENSLEGHTRIEYSSLADLIEKPETSKIALDIPDFSLDVRDAYRFQPDLRKNEYIRALSRKKVSGKIKASGYLSDIDLPVLSVDWGRTTQIAARGRIKNATNPDRLGFQVPSFRARSVRQDLIQFVNEEELGVQLPNDVLLQGKASGNLNDITASAELTTTQGIATVEGHFKQDTGISFDADLEVREYKLGELLKNEQMGALSLSIQANGSGANINSLNAELDANISSFQFKEYAIKDLGITGKIVDGEGDIHSAYKDENVDLLLDTHVVLDSVSPVVNAHLDVKGVNLQALGLMNKDVRAGLKLDADFEGSKDGFDVIATIGDGVVIQEGRTYLLGDVLATAHVRKDSTSIWVDNKILQVSVESNSDPATFGKAVQRHIGSYFSRRFVVPDSIEHPVRLKVIGRIAQAPVLNQVFLVNVQDLDTIQLGAYFDEKERRLAAIVEAPHINYGGNTLDSLKFTMDTDRDKFVFDLGFQNISAGPLDIPETHITGNQKEDILHLSFTAIHKDSIMSKINSQLSGTSSELRFHVKSDSLVLNKHNWTIPEDNEMVFTKDKIAIENMRFSHKDEWFELTDKLDQIQRDHIGVEFNNFKLSEILNYLNPEEELAKGILQGDLAVVEPFGKSGILADFSVRELEMLKVDMGVLSVDAKTTQENRYDFDVSLKEGDVDLDLDGNYIAETEGGTVDLALAINEVKMQALESFSLGEIKDADGSLNGRFTVKGSTKDPQYKGMLRFYFADFTVSKLNAPFTLMNEALQIDNSGLTMKGFTVLDENYNELVISGKVGTENFVNPTFDLKIDAEDFHILNATEEHNDFLHGKAAFDAHGSLSGDMNVPKLNMQILISDDTDVSYILPSATIAIEERDGIVEFVNREDPDAVLTRADRQKAKLTGMDINAFLKVDKEAKVAVIINQETGDNFQISGDADLNFTMSPNGRMTLTGIYDVVSGHYEMNLYGLVNRRFDLVEGSKVSWSGDPMDAKLDIKAQYKVETSASPLMAPVSSGADPAVKGKFRQVLPFYVYLNIDGELEKPVINFDLDMPEDEQGAIGGQVYGRIQQVNQQEGELNRQVFSLLVLSRFYPEPGSDGSQGGFASIARDNLNDAISDQLNAFSNKLLGKSGFELDFGLDSYTDYQGESPQQRTQLDIAAQKKLLDDRLIVRVGSEVDLEGSSSSDEPTPLIGNVSLEYYLTENGRYRLKGFRKNSYENVIDGQTIVSGLSLIFTQEFNTFDELWEAILRGETKKERQERREAQQRQREKDRKEKRRKEQIERGIPVLTKDRKNKEEKTSEEKVSEEKAEE